MKVEFTEQDIRVLNELTSKCNTAFLLIAEKYLSEEEIEALEEKLISS